MPHIIDKIIINGDRQLSQNAAIISELGVTSSASPQEKGILMLGREAEAAGMNFQDLMKFAQRAEASCDKHTAANRAHIDDLRGIERDLRHAIDGLLGQQKGNKTP